MRRLQNIKYLTCVVSALWTQSPCLTANSEFQGILEYDYVQRNFLGEEKKRTLFYIKHPKIRLEAEYPEGKTFVLQVDLNEGTKAIAWKGLYSIQSGDYTEIQDLFSKKLAELELETTNQIGKCVINSRDGSLTATIEYDEATPTSCFLEFHDLFRAITQEHDLPQNIPNYVEYVFGSDSGKLTLIRMEEKKLDESVFTMPRVPTPIDADEVLQTVPRKSK
ncbi:hypothetical protein IEN85_01815 [Pelagicoccus sp. NFK12]|uniref:Uncharacterized protein n=1 Tax=Pelagicoccus enzymogenes TaxID=2773457 RepID=A0A927IFW8_9BACT|nr:hypothetical protein [Pelagicoccus enzymogenes]MBD5778229.1 hypothetical protein [Pelagicoccus enzymogenes]